MPSYFRIVNSRGKVTIPAKIRSQFGIKPGDNVDFEIRDGTLRMVPRRSRTSNGDKPTPDSGNQSTLATDSDDE